jgi:CDP-glucose 4,6-dehydratase
VRPWQHVLEPLSGYLALSKRLLGTDGQHFATGWNFGPDAGGDATVGEVAGSMATLWGSEARVIKAPSADQPHEAGLLRLDSTRARFELGYRPRWTLRRALEETISWHRSFRAGADMSALSRDQIRAFETTKEP